MRRGDVVGYISGYQHVHWEPRRKLTWGRGESHRDIVLDPFEVVTDGAAASNRDSSSAPASNRASGFPLALVALAALAWWSR